LTQTQKHTTRQQYDRGHIQKIQRYKIVEKRHKKQQPTQLIFMGNRLKRLTGADRHLGGIWTADTLIKPTSKLSYQITTGSKNKTHQQGIQKQKSNNTRQQVCCLSHLIHTEVALHF